MTLHFRRTQRARSDDASGRRPFLLFFLFLLPALSGCTSITEDDPFSIHVGDRYQITWNPFLGQEPEQVGLQVLAAASGSIALQTDGAWAGYQDDPTIGHHPKQILIDTDRAEVLELDLTFGDGATHGKRIYPIPGARQMLEFLPVLAFTDWNNHKDAAAFGIPFEVDEARQTVRLTTPLAGQYVSGERTYDFAFELQYDDGLPIARSIRYHPAGFDSGLEDYEVFRVQEHQPGSGHEVTIRPASEAAIPPAAQLSSWAERVPEGRPVTMLPLQDAQEAAESDASYQTFAEQAGDIRQVAVAYEQSPLEATWTLVYSDGQGKALRLRLTSSIVEQTLDLPPTVTSTEPATFPYPHERLPTGLIEIGALAEAALGAGAQIDQFAFETPIDVPGLRPEGWPSEAGLADAYRAFLPSMDSTGTPVTLVLSILSGDLLETKYPVAFTS